VSVVTLNLGDSVYRSPLGFFRAQDPDLVVLQEAAKVPPELGVALAEYHLAAAGEFVVWSRYPIVRHDLLPGETPHARAVALRCEVAHPAGLVVLYNVHLPTRRAWLEGMLGHGLAAEMRRGTWGGVFSRAYRQQAAERLQAELTQARALAARVAAEARPTLVAGDFNALPQGAVHKAFAAALVDAFAERGRGYGWTVPASTGNPVALRRPRLRVDYIWCNAAWRVERCLTEPRGRSVQHLAVAARLRLAPPTVAE